MGSAIKPFQRVAFWKSELQPHLADPAEQVDLQSFPHGYCYFASAWDGQGGAPVVLLERCH